MNLEYINRLCCAADTLLMTTKLVVTTEPRQSLKNLQISVPQKICQFTEEMRSGSHTVLSKFIRMTPSMLFIRCYYAS